MTTTAAEPKSVAEAEVLGKGGIRYYRPEKLVAWPGLNPRTHFELERIRELAASIAEHGILQPLLVSPQDGQDADWVVAGESRLRAARLAEQGCPEIGLEPVEEIWIPAMVRELAEGEALAIAMLENVQRQNLTAIEEARGFARLLELNNWTQSRLAEEILGDHTRQSVVSNRLRLLDLPEEVVVLIETGDIHASHARDYLVPLLKLEDDQPAIAFWRVLNEINSLGEDDEIRGDWLQAVATRTKQDVIAEYSPPQLFEEETQPDSSVVPPASDQPDEAAEVPPFDPSAVPAREDQFDYLLNHALRPSGFVWSGLIAGGADDDELVGEISRAFKATDGETQSFKSIGSYKATAGEAPEIVILPLAKKNSEKVQGSELLAHVRRVLEIPLSKSAAPPPAAEVVEEPADVPAPAPVPKAETPKLAPKAAPKPAPAPAPAPPEAPAKPVATLPLPGDVRPAIPDGAGPITAILAVTAGRPCTMAIVPGASAVTVTLAPRITKAGETPLLLTAPSAAELDEKLIAALDAHFK